MISPINSLIVSNPFLPSSGASLNDLPDAPGLATSAKDTLTISQPAELAVEDGFRERISLKLRVRSEIERTEDGLIRMESQSRLRFRYDFTSDDGTKIRIRAKINLKQSFESDGSEQSQSIKFQAKLKVSVIQQDVSSDVAPLLDTPELPDAVKDVISSALELFQSVTDTATSLFLGSDPIDGDSLIAGLVDAFNQLSESIGTAALPAIEDPAAANPTNDAELVETVVPTPVEIPSVDVAGIENLVPVEVEAAPLAKPPVTAVVTEDVEPADAAETAFAANDDVDQIQPAAVESEPIDEGPEQVSRQQLASSEPVAFDVQSVMVNLRLKIVQSLTNLVGAFDSGASSQQVTQSVFEASAKLVARYEVRGIPDQLSSGQNVDESA